MNHENDDLRPPLDLPADWDEAAPLTDAQIDEMDGLTKAFTDEMFTELGIEIASYSCTRNCTIDEVQELPQAVLMMVRRVALYCTR
jgi:hypothetical protein